MKKISKRTLSLVLALLIMVGTVCVGSFSVIAADTDLVDSGATSASGHTVYLKNSAGWSSPNVYMWEPSDNNRNNAGWPGKPMTDEGDDIWSYEIDAEYSMIIFNGNGQTGDLTYPGDGMIYDNSTGKWEKYDTSPLRVTKFEADAQSPQYIGTAIAFTADTKSEASLVEYQFSVNGTVMQAYSSNKNFVWTPSTAGTFTVKLDVKDNAGNTNQRDMTFVINDPSKEVKPVFQSSTPSNNTQIKLNASTNVSVKAAGGNTGTKLLFYKYVVKDPSGTQMNTAYYTLNNAYAFTPKTEGDYTVEVSVQGSDNQTVKKTLTFTATNNPVTNPSTPTATVTNPSSPTVTDPQPSSPTVTDPQPSTPTVTEPDDPDYLMGDVDNNGVVDIRDASLIQKYVTRYSLNVFYEERADIDGDGKIQISDATYIQKLIAGIIK